MSPPTPIVIPDDELGRQAVSSLRGYAYQIWASALAWSRLRPDDTLLLEVADDYSLLSTDALGLGQVKDTAGSGSVTLATKGVREAINRLWRFSEANPDRKVTLAYLTTSPIGHERDLQFPGGASGMEYWRTAALEGADTAPIRTALGQLALDDHLTAWTVEASDGALHDRLLRPLRFVCAEPPLLELQDLLDEALAHLCSTAGARGTDVRRLRDGLVVDVLRTAILPDEEARRLGRDDLLRRIAAEGLHDLPAMGSTQSGSTVLDALEVSLDTGSSTTRPKAEADLSTRLTGGQAWLHGPSGIGKTALSRQVASRSNRPWFSLDLRDASSQDAARRLRAARQDLLRLETFGGVAIDDLNTSVSGAVKRELGLLLHHARREDAAVLVTAYNPPPPSVTAELGFAASSVMTAPRFTDEETSTLVERAGGDAERWARAINLFSGSGYPQLVAARIAALRASGWPPQELSRMLLGADDRSLDDEREGARRRLIEELSPAAASLLYRVSLLSGPFNRNLALDMGAAPPALPEAGAALDLLKGPWIEPLSGDRLRVSPLLSDAGLKTLSTPEQDGIHQTIVASLIGRTPISTADLPQLVFSTVRTSSRDGFSVIIRVALLSGLANDIIGRALYPLAFVHADRPLVPDDANINQMLRVAQIKVAAAQGMVTPAVTAFRRLALESGADVPGTAMRNMAAFTLVSAELDLSSADWFPIVHQMAPNAIEQTNAMIALAAADGVPMDGAPPSFPVDDLGAFLFTLRSHKLQGLDDLTTLIDLLEPVDRDRRETYFRGVGLQRQSDNRQTLVQTAWLAETRREGFDAKAAIARLEGLTGKVAAWPDPGMEIELICAQIVMLAEYADQPSTALALAEQALLRWPDTARFRRERVKVLMRLKRFDEIAADADRLLSDAAAGDAVERAFSARDVALATAERGDLQQAMVRFQAAAVTARETQTLRPYAIRLMADSVILRWRSGDRDGAIAAARDLFLAAEADTDSLHGQSGADVIRGLYFIGEVMSQDLASPGWDAKTSILGAASRSADPSPDLPQPHLLAAWYRLSEVEHRLNADHGVEAALTERFQSGRLVAFEAIRVGQRGWAAVTASDPARAADAIVARAKGLAWLHRERQEDRAAEIGGQMFQRVMILPWDGDLDPEDALEMSIALQSVLVAFAFAVARDDPDWLTSLRQASTDRALSSLLAGLPAPSIRLDDLPADMRALWALRQFSIRDHGVPELFIASAILHQWLADLLSSDEVAAAIGPVVAALWRSVADERRFALRSPSLYAPAIRAAADRIDTRAELARLLLEARPAMQVIVPAIVVLDWRGSAALLQD